MIFNIRLLMIAAAAMVAVQPATPSRADAPSVPLPAVEGPVASPDAPGSASKNYPFLATPVDLAARGYLEEEYFVSGTACRYAITGLGAGSIVDCGWPYRTRIVVRRPAAPEAFNGTVIAEWQNVTAQYDVDHYWLESSEHVMRSGYAWVGISAQRAGVQPLPPPANPLLSINTLKAWSPARYGTLDVTAGGAVLNDALRFDIYAQAVQALRAPAGTGPLGPLTAEVVVAAGTSQSGSNLAAFHNAVAPLWQPVVDGYFIGESRGPLRTDLEVPVFRLLSEVDVNAAFAPPDAPDYRHWEVAGSSHADAGFIENIQPLLIRDRVIQVPPTCTFNPLSRIPKRYAYHAAWDHLDAWIRNGTLPPTAPRIRFVDADPGPSVRFVIDRDAFGNARGGIRLSEHEVATALNGAGNGANPGADPGSALFCALFGLHLPFDAATLASLYPNHGRYVSQVARVNADNVRAGYLLPVDSEESTANAAGSGVGRR